LIFIARKHRIAICRPVCKIFPANSGIEQRRVLLRVPAAFSFAGQDTDFCGHCNVKYAFVSLE